jgi:hypothetical protein
VSDRVHPGQLRGLDDRARTFELVGALGEAGVPQRLATPEPPRLERTSGRERLEVSGVETSTSREVAHVGVRALLADRDDPQRVVEPDAADAVQAEAYGEPAVAAVGQRRVGGGLVVLRGLVVRGEAGVEAQGG